MVAISPKFTDADLKGATLDKKICIFEDQMRGWLLDHADMLASGTGATAQHAGFAILTLLLVYVEAIACFIKGEGSKNKSGDFFAFGLSRILPELDSKSLKTFHDDFYKQVRCGQLHQGMVRGKVQIVRGGRAAVFATLDRADVPIAIQIDPWALLDHVKKHFTTYVAQIRDPKNQTERQNFEKWFDTRAA